MLKTFNALKMLFLVALLGTISACAGLPNPPDIRPKQPLFKKGITHQYKISDYENMEYVFDKDLPLDSVNANFCYTLAEHQKLRNWIISLKQDYTCHVRTQDAQGLPVIEPNEIAPPEVFE